MTSKLFEEWDRISPRTAREIMTPVVFTVRPETPLDETVRLLALHHISGMPVVDGDRHVIGMVSEADLIDEQKWQDAVPRTVLYGALPISDEQLCAAARDGKRLRASDLMTRPVVTATEDATIHELADLMAQHWVHRIPIVRDGRLVGMVSRSDLIGALLEETWR